MIGERVRLFRCTECKFVIYIYIFRGTYVTTFISVGTAELGLSHFYRMASMRNVGGVKYQRWILAQFFFEKETRFVYCLAFGLTFCFLTMALTTVAIVSRLYT